MTATDQDRYTRVAIALHWAMALLILFNLSLGFFMEGFAPPLKRIIVPLHISSGITVLALTVIRILWRLTHRPPPFAPGLKPWERWAAHAAHGLLYVLMLVMTLSGWSLVSAHPPNPNGIALFFGTVHLPQISMVSHLAPDVQKNAHENFVTVHSIGAWTFVGLLTLHVLGALKHQWWDRHPELARMGIGRSRPAQH
jgi:cytochrome b561